jgi:hypothetical protein
MTRISKVREYQNYNAWGPISLKDKVVAKETKFTYKKRSGEKRDVRGPPKANKFIKNIRVGFQLCLSVLAE